MSPEPLSLFRQGFFSTQPRFSFRLGLVIFDGEPLHVARVICAATLEWGHMVNLIARTGAASLLGDRAGLLAFEFRNRGGTAR